ncbi:eukaryotic translation initiation factor 4G-like [Abeliophyllum distichum]|uniref:Eukaryotic translation initiation factor 4G-like n=1 Tax=Abeliophyllum distichum TaxID=126358 RepID=A0ABD1TFM8_9LAMI
MSHNQSRGDSTESGQYRKTGRSSSFNKQRHFSGGFKCGGSGGSSNATPANPSNSNRSFKKSNSNVQGGQFRVHSPNVIQDSSHSFPAPVVQNGAQQHQPPPLAVVVGVSDALVTSKSSSREVVSSSSHGSLLGAAQKKLEEYTWCSGDVSVVGDLIASTSMLDGGIGASAGDDKTSTSYHPVSVSSPSESVSKSENEGIENNSVGLASPPPPGVKEKVMLEPNAAERTMPRRKKKKRELYRKAKDTGTSSDLYMAYKGPEEKKETDAPTQNMENTLSKRKDLDPVTGQGLEKHYETSKDLGLLNVLLAFEDSELDKIVSLVKGINLETGATILVAKSEGHTLDSLEPIEQNDTDSDTSEDVIIHERFFAGI